jgi:predicted phosphoribosyltransferase
LIADQLEKQYRYQDCAVVALSDGAVVVGAEIAKRLHCVINMLLSSAIQLPREIDVLASIDNFGGVTYNDKFSPGELEEIKSEYFNYIEQQCQAPVSCNTRSKLLDRWFCSLSRAA